MQFFTFFIKSVIGIELFKKNRLQDITVYIILHTLIPREEKIKKNFFPLKSSY